MICCLSVQCGSLLSMECLCLCVDVACYLCQRAGPVLGFGRLKLFAVCVR